MDRLSSFLSDDFLGDELDSIVMDLRMVKQSLDELIAILFDGIVAINADVRGVGKLSRMATNGLLQYHTTCFTALSQSI